MILALVGLAGWWVYRPRAEEGMCPPGSCPRPPATREQPSAPPKPAPAATWRAALPGLDCWVRPVAEGKAELTLLRVDLARFRLEVVDIRAHDRPAATAAEVAEYLSAVAVINGGFFAENHEPLGLLVHAGKQSNPLRKVDWGLFLIRRGKAEIRSRRAGLPTGTTEALQVGPRLVIAGRIPSLRDPQALRSGVGIDQQGRVILAATSRGTLSLGQFARALKALGCRDALNLDGGGSTQLYVQAGKLKLDLPGLTPVPTFLALLPAESPSGH